jgi:hypothetical protein
VAGAPQGLTAKCYTGILGSTEENCGTTINSNPALGVNFESKATLGPKEGLTIVVGFPKGVVTEPTQTQKLIGRIQDNGIMVLPVLVLGFLYWLWRKFGKDPEVGTIVPEYEPPVGFSPAELQVLRKGREIRSNCLSANREILREKQMEVTKKLIDAKKLGYSDQESVLRAEYEEILKLMRRMK